MATDISRLVNEAGTDTVCGNSRVRANISPPAFTDSIGATTLALNPNGTMYIDGAGAPTTNAPTTSVTIAARWLLTGVIVLACANAVTATTDTATNIINAMSAVSAGVQVGDYIGVLIMNDSGNILTMAMGSGVTSANASTSTLPANTSRYCLFRVTNVTTPAVTMYF